MGGFHRLWVMKNMGFTDPNISETDFPQVWDWSNPDPKRILM
jgi:hypothetical protein